MPPASLTLIIGIAIMLGILIGGVLTTLLQLTLGQMILGFMALCTLAVVGDFIYIKVNKIK